MKAKYFKSIEKKSAILIIVCITLVTSCVTVRGVRTGVKLNNREIIVADRNVGAEVIDDIGKYFSWEEAKQACPRGYHVMTVAEARAIINDERYNSGNKLVNGLLRMPLGGYSHRMRPGAIVDKNRWGDYQLYE